MRSFFLLVFILLTSICCFAQGTSTGCLIDNTSDVYTVKETDPLINILINLVFGGDPIYTTPIEPESTACVNFTQTKYFATSQRCTVCPNGYNLLGLVKGCNGVRLMGYEANPSVVYCSLDDHSWLLGAAAGLFGVFIIRRRNKL